MICNEISFQLSHHLTENYSEAGTPTHCFLGRKRIYCISSSLQIENESKFKSLSTENVSFRYWFLFFVVCLFLL